LRRKQPEPQASQAGGKILGPFRDRHLNTRRTAGFIDPADQ